MFEVALVLQPELVALTYLLALAGVVVMPWWVPPESDVLKQKAPACRVSSVWC